MKNAIIFGATSAIAIETAKILASNNWSLCLVGRDIEKLTSVANAITTEHSDSKINTYVFNALDYSSHLDLIENIHKDIGQINLVIIAHGILPESNATLKFDDIRMSLEINMLSYISICENSAAYFENYKEGAIVAISSVAGDRGRQSNYIYGTAKGAISIYLQGFRNRLYSKNVNVITIKPGFVDTPMTSNFSKNFLFVKPEVIAKGIVDAIENRKDIVYLPFFWKYIMLIIKFIPEFIFKRLNL